MTIPAIGAFIIGMCLIIHALRVLFEGDND